MGNELDTTLQSFPTYAQLTQTTGWAKHAARIRADRDESADPAGVSHGSRYTEGAVLGVGGMGKVMLARDARIGREVAVKVLHAERELDADERTRFLREAQVQGQLEHPSIVPVYDIDRRSDGTTFFTMRRVLGRTLEAILDDLRKGVPAAKARYTQRELLTAFATVCLTVDYAHSRGVVHRDLKPANIMLGDFGEVYVLDWGLARLIDEQGATLDEPAQRLSMPGAFLGTPMYMAPEQMADPDVSPAADVYALGMILFELLTLERARDPNALYVPVDARPSVRTPARSIAPELETICVRSTEGEPNDRYLSPRAMQEAINRYLEGDRELEHRRQLASKHVATARIALGKSTERNADYETERGTAITELGRAVALDPQNGEYFAMLGDLMASPPPKVPHEVATQVDTETQRVMHFGAKYSLLSIGAWWLFVPVMWWIGLRHAEMLVWIAIPNALTIIVAVIMIRKRVIGTPIQYVSIIMTLIAAMAVSRIYGPYVIVATIITNFAIVVQTHPVRQLRRLAGVGAAVALILPTLLEWSGVVPTSYLFEHGVWTILPQIAELPRLGTNLVMIAMNLGLLAVPCLLVARLRNELSDAQVALAVQAWHFRRLGAQLIGKAA